MVDLPTFTLVVVGTATDHRALYSIRSHIPLAPGARPMIVTSEVDARYQTTFSNGTVAAVADVPREKGGAGQGFGPHDLVEAAIATCMTITVRKAVEKKGIPLTAVRCEAILDRSNPTAVTLNYTITFEGLHTTAQATRLREAAARCPVARTLANGVRVSESPARLEGRR